MTKKVFALALILIATATLEKPALAIRMQNMAQIDSQFGLSDLNFVNDEDALAAVTDLDVADLDVADLDLDVDVTDLNVADLDIPEGQQVTEWVEQVTEVDPLTGLETLQNVPVADLAE